MNGCVAVGQTVGETDGHPTVITRQCDVGQTDKQTDRHPNVIIRACGVRCASSGRCAALGQIDGQTDGHLTVIIRACDRGRISSRRLPSSKTDRQTDRLTDTQPLL